MSRVRLTGSTSGYVEITAPATAGNNTVTLPSSNGSANQLLKNGATPGVLEYSTVRIGSTGELDNIASINGGPLAGFRNAIINGNFDIWQRGTSFSSPANGTYTADRWLITYDGSGATRTISQNLFVVGSTEAAPGASFYLEHAQTVAGSGAAYNTLIQRIEGVRTFEGQTVTLSFYARGASAALTLPSIIFRQNFGAGGSAFVDTTVAANVVIAGTYFAKYTYTVTLPSISGKTVGSGDSMELILFLPINTTFNFHLASVQLEPGSVATPFEQRPIGTELALCQRYFQKNNGSASRAVFQGYVINGSDYLAQVQFPVAMRITPTVSVNLDDVFGFPSGAGTVTVDPAAFTQTKGSDSTQNSGYFISSWTAYAEL